MHDRTLERPVSKDMYYMQQKDYWRQKLSGTIERTRLFTNYDRTMTRQESKATFHWQFPQPLARKLINVSTGSNLSLYIILLAALKTLAHRYTGVTCCAIGSPVCMLNYSDATVNNYVVLVDRIEGVATFKDLIFQVKKTCQEAYANQDCAFEEIVKALDRNVLETPLFDIICLLKNIHEAEFVKDFQGDLLLAFFNDDGKITLDINYEAERVPEGTIERFCHNYVEFLDNALTDIDKPISNIKAITIAEETVILNEFNHTAAEFDSDTTLAELVELTALQVPEKVALVYGNRECSYKELNQKANRLAADLQRNGVGPASIVGIMLERSIELIVGLLAILKAGGAYLPLDPEFQKQRLLPILAETGVKVLLTSKSVGSVPEIAKETEKSGLKILYTEKLSEALESESGHNLPPIGKSSDPAYVLYTSGSTGKPKGIVIEQRSVINLVQWFCKEYDLKTNNNVLQLTNVTFDVSVEEIFGSLVSGATLFIPDKDTILDRERLRRFIAENKISIAQFVPVTLREYLSDGEKISCLKKVICGGDRLDKKLNNQILELGYELFNHYGPTETTVDALTARGAIDRTTLGKPLANVKVYIVDQYLNLQPMGVTGEICISGAGLARGYLADVPMTQKAFVANPFEPGTLMYKTGDLGRWLPEGEIEFAGRIDNQVKIRGFRVEAGEIEYWLRQFPKIKDAVVTVKEGNTENKNLCAYLTGEDDVDPSEVKAFLKQYLPDFMIPAYVVWLKAFPLHPNGKVNLKILPNPESIMTTSGCSETDAPRNEIETTMVTVWQEVFGRAKVSIEDDFFNIGGDSIKAIQIVSRMQKRHLKMDIKDLLAHRKIRDLSSYVKSIKSHVEDGAVSGVVPLTPIQKWFFQQKFIESNHWNQSVMLFSERRFEPLSVTRIFEKLIEHHDALRIAFDISGTNVRAFNNKYSPRSFELITVNLAEFKDCKQRLNHEIRQIQKSIVLNRPPLMAAALFNMPEGDYLLIAIHHLVVDGISLRILLEDFSSLHRQLLHQEELKLQPKTTSFKKWAEQITQYASSAKLLGEIAYWSKMEKLNIDAIPKEMIADSDKLDDSMESSIGFSQEDTKKFLKEVNQVYNTDFNDILLTALGLAVKKWIGVDRVLINLEGHGREEFVENMDVSRTVGWFTTEYPVVLDLQKSDDISYIIRYVKESLRQIPGKGLGYGVLKYITPPEQKSNMEFKLQPEISFNYLGQFDIETDNEIFRMEFAHTSSCGESNSRTNPLDIYGMVRDGRLGLTCSYNRKQFKNTTIETFMEYFKTNLIAIIRHCTENCEKKPTPSDLGYGKLSLEALDKITQQIKHRHA